MRGPNPDTEALGDATVEVVPAARSVCCGLLAKGRYEVRSQVTPFSEAAVVVHSRADFEELHRTLHPALGLARLPRRTLFLTASARDRRAAQFETFLHEVFRARAVPSHHAASGCPASMPASPPLRAPRP